MTLSAERLRRVHDVLVEITSTFDQAHLCNAIIRGAMAEGVDAASLMLRDRRPVDQLKIVDQQGLSEEYASRQRIPFERTRPLYEGPGKHLLVDLRTMPLGDKDLVRREGLAWALAVPLFFQDELVGCLNLYLKEGSRSFTEDDIEVAHLLGAQASVALTNARLYSEEVELRAQHERLAKEKDEFLSLVTHELKTPLTPLKSVAQLIRMRLRRARAGERELDLEALDRNLGVIERQTDRMDRIVTDLLEVSRIGRGRFELAPVPMDLAAVAREVVQRWSEVVAEDSRHRLDVDIPETLPLTADRDRIEQVIANLVSNALKYSPRGGLVSIRAEERPGEAVVAVTDEGIGVTQEDIAMIGKEPFVRAPRARGFAGVGVGLYLSRLIAEGHGGRIELESDGEDKGTTARLILPR